MPILPQSVRSLLHGRAAAYRVGDVVYVEAGDKWVRTRVRGVKRDQVYVLTGWIPTTAVRRDPPK